MNKFLITSLIVNLILLIVIGWLLLDAGAIRNKLEISEIRNQLNQTNNTVQQIVNFLNQSIQQNQNVQK